MARTATILSIFLASPSDVSQEREIVTEVIAELNQMWSRRFSVYFEIVKWETHSFPDVNTDPQNVINSQIENDYDIFIGILSQRFGTPTGRAGSGTEEEFDRAFLRHLNNPGSVSLMCYFNVEGKCPRNVEETDQLARVFKFKNSLAEKGVLYGEYPGSEQFSSVLRIHLTRQLQKFLKSNALVAATSITQSTNAIAVTSTSDIVPVADSSVTLATDEDTGIIELSEAATAEILLACDSLARLSAAQNSLTETFARQAAEINGISNPGTSPDMATVKRVLNDAAATMNSFADDLGKEASELSGYFKRAMASFSKVVALAVDFGENGRAQIQTVVPAAGDLSRTIVSAAEGVECMKDSVKRLPRATTAFNQARRRVIDVLEKLGRELIVIADTATLMETTAREALENWPS